MSLKERMREDNCDWLDAYLKSLIQLKDLKTYNMAKTVMYYFPQIVEGITKDNFELAMKHYKDTYICLGQDDSQYRYKVFDEMYKQKHGREFEPNQYGETRYLTIGELCEYFKKS